MLEAFNALDPMEIAVATVALCGIVPVVVQYRERSKWFALGYGMLVVAALSTNLEGLLLGTVFNLAEHGIGLMGAGLAFFAAAYVHRKREIEGGEVSADG